MDKQQQIAKSANDNKSDQCNPNNPKYQGHQKVCKFCYTLLLKRREIRKQNVFLFRNFICNYTTALQS